MKLTAFLALAAVLLTASLSAAAPVAPAASQAEPAVTGLPLFVATAGGPSCSTGALAFEPAPSPSAVVVLCGSCSSFICSGKNIGARCGSSGVCAVFGSCAPFVQCKCVG
jgi:hypothetical protein